MDIFRRIFTYGEKEGPEIAVNELEPSHESSVPLSYTPIYLYDFGSSARKIPEISSFLIANRGQGLFKCIGQDGAEIARIKIYAVRSEYRWKQVSGELQDTLADANVANLDRLVRQIT